MTDLLKVAVIGAGGRMGKTCCDAIEDCADMQLVARLGRGDEITAQTLRGAQVAVEFTIPSASFANTEAILRAGAHAVVGTSGWTEDAQVKIQEVARETGKNVLIAPNFALSAVLVMVFSRLAAPFFTSAEIVETHHPNKLDAPSGTALATAQQMAASRQQADIPPAPDATTSDPEGARGMKVGDVGIHSLRLLGANAHQEVILGNQGEQLRLGTDCFDRSSFMPGMLLAVRKVAEAAPLTVGLDKVMDLGI